jgi:FAD/FMN-containing dehydrogenase
MMPGSFAYASLGGMVNTNTSGHILDCARGKPSDHVMGVEVVLSTGEVLETGTKSLRRPSGTDLTKFFAAGDGLLGIVTMARVRMLPLFKSSYGVAYFEDVEPLARAIQILYWENVPLPLCSELLDKRCSDIGFSIVGLEPAPGPLFMWQSMGRTEEEASANCDEIIEVIRRGKHIEVKKIDSAHWAKLWRARGQIYPYIARHGFALLSEVVSPVGELVNMLDEVKHFQEGMPTLEEMGDPYFFGHIGALTYHLSYPLPLEWPPEKRARAQREMFMKESMLNTKYETCGGEWGQFSIRAPFFVSRYGEKAYELVKGMKKVFDPNNILNPGVLEGTMAGENWEEYKFKREAQ